jgi:hypothetical protein
MKFLSIALGIMFLTLGCASKKAPEERGLAFAEKVFDLVKRLDETTTGGAVAEAAIKSSPLPQDFRMAVFFLPAEGKKQNWHWSRKEKDMIIKSLEKEKRASQVFELINTTSKRVDMDSLRVMAAQQGADAVFLVRGVSAVKTPLNAMALTYLAIVPVLFVEGNQVESTFVTQGILWNARTPYVHMGLESEGDWKMQRPLAFRQIERAVDKSREESIQRLSQKIEQQLPRIKI